MGLESRDPLIGTRRLQLVGQEPSPAAALAGEVVAASSAVASAPEDPVLIKAMAKVMRKQVAGGQRIILLSDRAALVIADILDPPAPASSATS